MKFTAATLLLAAGVSAQLPQLPPDISSYAMGLQTNPAALSALLGIFTAPAVQSVASAARAGQLTGLPAVQSFQAAVQQAISAEPESLRPIASSIVNAIAPLALTDGILGGGAAATGAVSSAIGSASSAVGSAVSSAMSASGSAMSASGSAMSMSMSMASGMTMASGSSMASGMTMASGSSRPSGTSAGTVSSAAAHKDNVVVGSAALLAGGLVAVLAL